MAWLTGWNRRKQITVNGSTAGAQSDYQVRLTVNQGSGSDSAGIVYLSGNVLSTFNDLRFTKSDGITELYYWIESITGTSPNLIATVWIKLAPSPDTIPSSPGTYNFYIYYNNPSPSDGYGTNGDNTFTFFDDFTSPTLDATKWMSIPSGTISYSISGSIFTASGSITNDHIVRGYESIPTFGLGTALRGRIKINHLSEQAGQTGYGIRTYPTTTSCFNDLDYTGAPSDIQGYIAVANGTTESGAAWNSDSNYHIFDLIRSSSASHRAIISDGILDSTITTSVPTGNMPIILGAGNWGGRSWPYTYYVDWYLVRKYVSPEPTFGATGTEEIPPPSPPNIGAISMTVSPPSESPCRAGICTVNVSITWKNTGGSSGSSNLSITVSGGTPTITPASYPSVSFAVNQEITQSFTVSNMAAGTHSICPNPN